MSDYLAQSLPTWDVTLQPVNGGDPVVVRIYGSKDAAAASLSASYQYQRETGIVTTALEAVRQTMIEPLMIDHDQLTEALAAYDGALDEPEGGPSPAIQTIVEAARLLLDFPTDEQVEAAANTFANIATKQGWDDSPDMSLTVARAVLEAVRQQRRNRR